MTTHCELISCSSNGRAQKGRSLKTKSRSVAIGETSNAVAAVNQRRREMPLKTLALLLATVSSVVLLLATVSSVLLATVSSVLLLLATVSSVLLATVSSVVLLLALYCYC